MSNSFLVFNQASSVQYADLVKGDIRMNVVIPADPATSDSRKFGLYSPAKDSGIYFEVTGTTFRAVAKDGVSGNIDTVTLAYDSAWTLLQVEYRIVWEAGLAHFYIEDTKVATIAFSDEDLDLNVAPMSLYISNANADDMYVGYIEATGVQTYI